ncbi:MAG: hypothetical protein ACK41D_10530 [Rubricoccaceae bacterium]
MRLLLLLFVLLAPSVAAAQVYSALYLPFSGTDEGCRNEYRTTSAVNAHSAATEQSATIRVVLANRLIEWNDYDEVLTAVVEPGLARARRAAEVRLVPARLSAQAAQARTLRVPEGGAVTVLAYAGGGEALVVEGGQVFSARLPGVFTGASAADAFALERTPVTETWLRLVPREDRPAAWLNASQAGVVQTGVRC